MKDPLTRDYDIAKAVCDKKDDFSDLRGRIADAIGRSHMGWNEKWILVGEVEKFIDAKIEAARFPHRLDVVAPLVAATSNGSQNVSNFERNEPL